MVENFYTEFANRLNLACDRHGLSPAKKGRNKELAKLINVSEEMARRYLKGSDMPRENKRSLIADKLKTSRAWLFEGVGWIDQLPPKGNEQAYQENNHFLHAPMNYRPELERIQTAIDKGIFEESDRAILKIIAEKYKDKF
jgi:transcriptional regulator with XRE-family HTH domain